jgi:hypothetical protein
MTTNNANKTEFEKGIEVINSLAKDFSPREANSGVSYFKGKNRLCKILKTKKGISLEINVRVPKATENKFKLESLTDKEAKEKHLGTMKYKVTRMDDTKALKEILPELIKAYKKAYEEEPKATEESKATEAK